MIHPFRWINRLDHEPFPHNAINGLKKGIFHLGTFGPAGALAVKLTPPPFNFAVAGGLGIWRAAAEWKDYKQKRDTGPKAVIDFITQTFGAAAALLLQ